MARILGRRPIDIDAKLAPLIRLLWSRDILTMQSCQEYKPGLAMIEFPGTVEVMEFLEVAQSDYRVELETWDESEEDGQYAIIVSLHVLFPTKDIPRLVEAFAATPRNRP
jgi:hypothetical protein